MYTNINYKRHKRPAAGTNGPHRIAMVIVVVVINKDFSLSHTHTHTRDEDLIIILLRCLNRRRAVPQYLLYYTCGVI